MSGLGFDGTERPLRDAALALTVCTVLAFASVALLERTGMIPPKPSPRLRRNGYRVVGPFFGVQVVPDKGDWFGQVVDLASGQIVWETFRERDPFVAKRRAEARCRRLEAEARAAARALLREEEQPSRTTSGGTVLRLVPPPRRK